MSLDKIQIIAIQTTNRKKINGPKEQVRMKKDYCGTANGLSMKVSTAGMGLVEWTLFGRLF